MKDDLDFQSDHEKLVKSYTDMAKLHGDSPQAVQQADYATQERRMQILCEAANLEQAKILDFGCGTGHLLQLLREKYHFKGEYVGYDITAELLSIAKQKFPQARFEERNVLRDGLEEEFDIVIISGVFNNKIEKNWDWMTRILQVLFAKTTVALAFNNLSQYVDFLADDLYYADPAKVFQFCKEELSPLVTLRHDYHVRENVVPYEFTTYVYRSPLSCRTLN